MSYAVSRRSLLGGTAAAGALLIGAPLLATSTAEAATLPVLRAGSKGAAVTQLQQALSAAGFWCGTADGTFGGLTTQAVYAVQKAAGLRRDGVVGAQTWVAVNAKRRPTVRSKADGIEIDKARQLLLVVRGGVARVTLNTSTGSGQKFTFAGRQITAATPAGTFKVWWKYPSAGWQQGSLGYMWRPYYFNGDIAIHGATEIPPYPASHGCARLSTGAQDMLIASGLLTVGTQVRVY